MMFSTTVISFLAAALAPSAVLAQSGNFFEGCYSVPGSPYARCCTEYVALPGGNYTGLHCSGADVSEDSSILYCPTPNPYKAGAVYPSCCQQIAPSNATALDGKGYECTLESASTDVNWP
ncbi:hypothetical protein F5Y16DRAFT_331629 [Xylariaceae sp. FL0255]|nr:hypothetical protein F5Y16DRAFT_331629 [Xylariaceae sp. FL0255]